MKQVNFLPADRLQGTAIKRYLPALLGGMFLAVTALVIPWQILQTQQDSLGTQLLDVEKQIGVVADGAIAAKANELSKKNADGIARTKAINSLVGSELDYNTLFTVVQQILPADIALSSLSVTSAQGVPTIRFSAKAPSNASYANFLLLLRNDTRFVTIVTDGYSYNASDGSVAFSITLTLKQIGVVK